MHELLLKNLSRFISVSADEAKAISALFTHKKFRKKQYILQEGSVCRVETFVIKGLTRTYQVDSNGQEHVVQFGPEDWWVGDLYSFLTEAPSIYNIDCLEDTEVLQISKPDLEKMYERVPKMERHFRIMIQHAYIASTRRVSGTLSKSALERYDDFITQYPQIGQRVPNHQIASYLGVTPQSLSRIRSQSASRSK